MRKGGIQTVTYTFKTFFFFFGNAKCEVKRLVVTSERPEDGEQENFHEVIYGFPDLYNVPCRMRFPMYLRNIREFIRVFYEDQKEVLTDAKK